MLPFHANLLQAALVTNQPAQPMALRFIDTATGQTSFAPSFVGDETLLGSVWRTLAAPPITAVVRFGEPQRSGGRERREWAENLRREVEALWRA
jgi:1-acyl-sn-glycerol-3-phosphate acyltransferase